MSKARELSAHEDRRVAAAAAAFEQLSLPVCAPDAGAPNCARPATPPPYRVRLSHRARALQISVTPWRGVEVIVPRRTSAKRVHEFVRRHGSWIETTWRELLALYPGQVGAYMPDTVELAALGEHWRIEPIYGGGERSRTVEHPEGRLAVHAASEADGVQVLRHWLRRRAADVLPAWLACVARETGTSYARCQVRGQRTRWGSCSTSRTITLNYKLLFVRPALVRYLMVHELSHTRFFNHSKRFWALVAAFLPDALALDAELDDAWTQVPGWAGE